MPTICGSLTRVAESLFVLCQQVMGPVRSDWPKMSSTTLREVSHIAKFDGTNFPVWKLGLWVLLEQHSLIDIVTGVSGLPPEVNRLMLIDINKVPPHIKLQVKGTGILANVVTNAAAVAEWKQKDCQARGYLLSTTEVLNTFLWRSNNQTHPQ